MRTRLLTFLAVIGISILATATAASACGFLVAPNGAVRLLRTSTLVTWDGEIERYITSFEFQSAEASFGSIIPLPDEPTDVRKAGEWTLQRLEREVRPTVASPTAGGAEAFSAQDDADVEVILTTRVDSLDITVVKGGGTDVLEWANDNGFTLDPSAAELLDFYSDRSPYFLAAKFDASAAVADGFSSGDGIPILVEIPTDRPWVPLRILGFGKPGSEIVEADVFLLTPERPELLHGMGLDLNRSERASNLLLDDLRGEEGMEWIPDDAWFTHLEIDTPAEDVDFDLSVGVGDTPPSLAATGLIRGDVDIEQLRAFGLVADEGLSPAGVAAVASLFAAIVGAAAATIVTRRRTTQA